MLTKTKKILLISSVVIIFFIIAFIVTKSKKTPIEKTIEAMTTPGTYEFIAISEWNKVHHPGASFESVINDHVKHHTNPANPDAFIHKFL